jgi:hypothetical protein
MYATKLKILVLKNNETVVDLSMPAISATWIIDLMPQDVLRKISEKGIDLKSIQDSLSSEKQLLKQSIFELITPEKTIKVWLE